LPEPWRGILGFGVNDQLTLAIVESRFRELVRKWHPDVDGGDRDTFEAITGAREQASNELVA
jgi:DnaJ-class molecular chaperone